MLTAQLAGHVGTVKLVKKDAVGDKPAFTVLQLSVASNAKTSKGPVTNWTSVKLWGPRAEALAPHVSKGQAVAITGRPEAQAYNGESGLRADLVIHADTFEFIGAKPEAAPAGEVALDAPVAGAQD